MLFLEQNPPIQAVIDTGVVPRFVEFLHLNDNAVSFNICTVCSNLV